MAFAGQSVSKSGSVLGSVFMPIPFLYQWVAYGAFQHLHPQMPLPSTREFHSSPFQRSGSNISDSPSSLSTGGEERWRIHPESTNKRGPERHGVHLCHKCGWAFPNPHPSAKNRRAHKKVCGTIQAHKTRLEGSADDHLSVGIDDTKTPSIAVEEEDTSRLPYLHSVIKETFRMHPPVPFLIPRKTDSDVELCGFTVPKDSQVLVNVWAMGRDPTLWKDPSSFEPERFLGTEIDVRGQHFELVPFGAGRRICPGLPLAMRMLPLMLGSLINCFDWKLEDGVRPQSMDMNDKFGITLQKAQPLRAIPINRPTLLTPNK